METSKVSHIITYAWSYIVGSSESIHFNIGIQNTSRLRRQIPSSVMKTHNDMLR
jgi:hypothetical protein